MAGSFLMSNRLIGQHAAYHAPRVRLRVGSAALQTICVRSDMASASEREDASPPCRSLSRRPEVVGASRRGTELFQA